MGWTAAAPVLAAWGLLCLGPLTSKVNGDALLKENRLQKEISFKKGDFINKFDLRYVKFSSTKLPPKIEQLFRKKWDKETLMSVSTGLQFVALHVFGFWSRAFFDLGLKKRERE